MRKLCSVVAVVVFALTIWSPGVWADTKFDIGLKAGLNFATMKGSDAKIDGEGPGAIVRGSGGGYASLRFSDNLAIQAEIYYNQKGAEWEYSTTSNDTTWNYRVNLGLEYLEISVLTRFTVPTSGKFQPFMFAGPAIAINANSEAKYRTTAHRGGVKIMDMGDDYYSNIYNAKGTLIEAVLGGGLEMKLGSNKLSIEGRYTFSFGKAFDDIDDVSGITGNDAVVVLPSGKGPEMKHGVFSVLIGLSFPL
jgi:hypothetical protein